MLYSVPTKLYGAHPHNRQGTVNWRIPMAFLAGGIPAALVGVGLLYYLRIHFDAKLITLWTRHTIGSKLCGRIHTRWLRPAVALMLVFVAARLV